MGVQIFRNEIVVLADCLFFSFSIFFSFFFNFLRFDARCASCGFLFKREFKLLTNMYKNLFSILSLGKIKAKKKEHKEILLETTCHKMVQ